MSKPARLEYSPEHLDALRTAFGDLCNAAIFTAWEWRLAQDKWTKKPLHPAGHQGVTFAQAMALYSGKTDLAGLGVKLGPVPRHGCVLFGVDYDGSDKGPLPQPWPQTDTYCERSPSGGDKFHVLGLYKGTPLQGKRRGAVEVYSEGRFFTLTGDRLNGAAILATDPRPYYAAVGVNSPQPYGTAPDVVDVPTAPTKENDLTDRERRFLAAVRGVAIENKSDQDYAVCVELISRGATDEEAARILCAGFWRPKFRQIWQGKTYVAHTVAKARKAAGPTEAEAAAAQAAAVARFRQQSKVIGEGPSEGDCMPPVFSLPEMLEQMVFISDGSQVAWRKDPRLVWSFADFENLTAASVVRKANAGRPEKVCNVWRRDPLRVTVHARTFRAGAGFFCRSPQDVLAINTWREPPRMTPPKDWQNRAKPFLDHLAYLVPETADQAFLLDWLAHLEQHPGVLPHVHVLMYTPRHGIGRNWLSSVLARVWAGSVALDGQSLFD